MLNTQSHIRIHEFAGAVGLDTPDTPTIYFTAADARALARELVRFADSVGGRALARHTYPVARVVADGVARNEGDGSRRPKYLGPRRSISQHQDA